MRGFKQVSAARYDDMLNILPPALWLGRGFLVGEPMRHDDHGRAMFTAFLHTGRGEAVTYYEALEPMTVRDFRALCEALR